MSLLLLFNSTGGGPPPPPPAPPSSPTIATSTMSGGQGGTDTQPEGPKFDANYMMEPLRGRRPRAIRRRWSPK